MSHAARLKLLMKQKDENRLKRQQLEQLDQQAYNFSLPHSQSLASSHHPDAEQPQYQPQPQLQPQPQPQSQPQPLLQQESIWSGQLPRHFSRVEEVPGDTFLPDPKRSCENTRYHHPSSPIDPSQFVSSFPNGDANSLVQLSEAPTNPTPLISPPPPPPPMPPPMPHFQTQFTPTPAPPPPPFQFASHFQTQQPPLPPPFPAPAANNGNINSNSNKTSGGKSGLAQLSAQARHDQLQQLAFQQIDRDQFYTPASILQHSRVNDEEIMSAEMDEYYSTIGMMLEPKGGYQYTPPPPLEEPNWQAQGWSTIVTPPPQPATTTSHQEQPQPQLQNSSMDDDNYEDKNGNHSDNENQNDYEHDDTPTSIFDPFDMSQSLSSRFAQASGPTSSFQHSLQQHDQQQQIQQQLQASLQEQAPLSGPGPAPVQTSPISVQNTTDSIDFYANLYASQAQQSGLVSTAQFRPAPQFDPTIHKKQSRSSHFTPYLNTNNLRADSDDDCLDDKTRLKNSKRTLPSALQAPAVGADQTMGVGLKMLSKMGWTDGSGLGVDGEGRKTVVEIDFRLGLGGIGAQGSTFVMGQQQQQPQHQHQQQSNQNRKHSKGKWAK